MAGQAIRAMLKRLLQNAQQPGAPIGQQGSRLTKAPAAGASLVGQRPKPSLSRQAPGAGVSQQQQLDNEVQYRNLLAAAPDVDVPREIEGKLSFEDKLAQEVEREKQLGAVRTGYAKELTQVTADKQGKALRRKEMLAEFDKTEKTLAAENKKVEAIKAVLQGKYPNASPETIEADALEFRQQGIEAKQLAEQDRAEKKLQADLDKQTDDALKRQEDAIKLGEAEEQKATAERKAKAGNNADRMIDLATSTDINKKAEFQKQMNKLTAAVDAGDPEAAMLMNMLRERTMAGLKELGQARSAEEKRLRIKAEK
jgi:hypothetical protein